MVIHQYPLYIVHKLNIDFLITFSFLSHSNDINNQTFLILVIVFFFDQSLLSLNSESTPSFFELVGFYSVPT